MNYRDLLRKSIKDIEKLEYGEKPQGLLFNLNTNPLGANPAAKAFFEPLKKDNDLLPETSDLSKLHKLFNGLNLYPGLTSKNLREKLANFYGLDPQEILISNGSNENLDIFLKTFINPGETVAIPSPSYTMYPVYIKINMGKPYQIPLQDKFKLDLGSFLESKAKLFIISSPNNPTGNNFRKESILEILQRKNLVLIDEAYGEFSDQNFLSYIRDYPNLIVSRTFSKAWGLAGIRLGYLIANKKLISELGRVKPPFNVNSLSQFIATLALEWEDNFVEGYKNMVKEEKTRLALQLVDLGFKIYPSDANFLLVKSPVETEPLVERLKEESIYIKDVSGYPQLSNHLRITIGTREMNGLLIDKMKDFV